MNNIPPKRIAVIGAGASGLPAIKACLDEGLEPVCYERSDAIGGLWRYTETPIDGQACVMKSTIINSSKEMMAFSDFPIPGEFPNFMHNTQVYKYFKMYANQFDLIKYIRFNTEILHIRKADNFSKNGRWEIRSCDRSSQEEKTEVCDGVLVCTGHHAEKYEPSFPGLKEFQGKVLHSHDYRCPDGMENKRVLIIGIGNSGGDAAVELSRRASQVLLSTRRGTWVLNRVGTRGYPLGMVLNTRFSKFLAEHLPRRFTDWRRERALNLKFDHAMFGLKPDYPVSAQHPMVNDDLPNRIVCGSIKIKADVKKFTSTGVQFVDGTEEEDIDVVILATGYSFGFPFIDKEVIDVKENRIELYKYMFPPDLERQTLAVIGCIQPIGAVMPTSELQCRLAVRVFKNDVILPPKADQWSDIRAKEDAMSKRYVKSRRHTIQVDYTRFMDELAQLNGCSTDLCKLLFSDPKLALSMIFGPVTPYHYRVTGPGKWSGAREAILTQWDRTHQPLQTRKVPRADDRKWPFIIALALVVVFFIRFFF